MIILNKDDLNLNPIIWNSPYFPKCVYTYYRFNSLGCRKVISNTKTRAEVAGSTRKIRMQKHTGRARAGTIRSPQFRGGGIVFGPTSQKNYKISINKKEMSRALSSIISRKILLGNVNFIDSIPNFSEYNSKNALGIFNSLGFERKGNEKFLFVLSPEEFSNSSFLRSSLKNFDFIRFTDSLSLNSLNLLNIKNIIFTKDSISSLEKRILRKKYE